MAEERDIYADFMRRDQTEKERLDEQFELISSALGYILHPSIQKRLPPNPNVADIATGTGIFLTAISKERDCARLDGFDISSSMFPPADTLPEHTSLRIADAKKPLPKGLHGMYDLVHVRYLTIGMDRNDWPIVAANLMMLLKPGGALQWEEPNLNYIHHLRGGPQSTVGALEKGRLLFHGKMLEARLPYGWSTLPEILRNMGLEVETDVVSTDIDPSNRKALTVNGVMGMIGGARTLAAKGVLNNKDLAELEKGMAADVESGSYLRYDVHVAVAFKGA